MNPTDAIHSIKFQRPINVQDPESGEDVTTWQDVPGRTAVPAQVLTGPSPEAIRAGAKYDDIDLRVNLWWFDGLTSAWRVVWQAQSYDIVSVSMDVTAQKEWRLVCKKLGDGT